MKLRLPKTYRAALAMVLGLSSVLPNALNAAQEEVSSLYAYEAAPQNTYSGIFDTEALSRVSVHDPSIVIGYKKDGKITGEPSEGAEKVYYIFGSHKAFARSSDLQNWHNFTNNISSDFAKIFADDAKWAAHGGTQGNSSYNVSGNLWAPDVIWNKDMQKWCMYMSVNGDKWFSSIVMLTAETPDGDWTRVGPVVYSGFTNASQAAETDFYKVYSGTDFPQRYNYNRNGNHTYGMNAIDPCVFYDEDGEMWLIYGSWFGGLYMLRLDKTTGMRDYDYTYTTDNGTAAGAKSDVYQGIKIAGGNHCSGEAPYIEHIGDRYYLFVTYGGLTANGGYNMRVFSSENVTGPYTDMAGHSAIYSTNNTSAGDPKRNVGSRLMSYYKLDLLGGGYVAQGHNSAVVDTDGKIYVVYHTRFTNAGEGHEVRVHQLFVAKHGGLVAAPFEYRGEELADTQYPVDEITGKYRVIMHNGTDFANLACQKEKSIELKADGTIDGAYKGTWTADADKPYISIKIGGTEYQGVLIKQQVEGLNHTALCFTTLGKNDIPLWGFKDVSDVIADNTGETLPYAEDRVLSKYATGAEFNASETNSEISETTGLSLSFFVFGLGSDWDEIGKSSDGKFTLYLSVLRYAGADFYEAAATPDPNSPVQTDLWKAFLNGGYYATVSYNADGTISFYRDGILLFTFAADLKPNYGSGVTTADIAKAAIDYYRAGKLDFTHQVYNVAVSYSVPYATSGIEDAVIDMANEGDGKAYNLLGMPVDDSYRGIVVINGKKYLRK